VKKFLFFFHLIRIQIIFIRFGLDRALFSLPFLFPLRFLIYLNPFNWGSKNKQRSLAQSIRLALQALGPIFVKFGQALSTRGDLLPEELIQELSLLQDKVLPFSDEEAQCIVENTYGQPLAKLFKYFNPSALASASIAQVHEATLFDGKEVIVKILRPKIHSLVDRDLQLLFTFAHFAEKYWPTSRLFHPTLVVSEFKKNLEDELNLITEAANASQLRRQFHDSPILYIPEVFWSYARENILVQERIYGIPISDRAALEKQGINIPQLAINGVEIFFQQVFENSFFHADMHPGNIFVSYHHKKNPQYICVDFGIVGLLSESDKRYLAENFHAFFNRDYKRVAELHIQSGWLPSDTRVEDFAQAIRVMSEPIFEKPLSEISFAQTLMHLLRIGHKFNMNLQPQLVLLQKTLFAIEGLGRQLYPQLDLWKTAKPYFDHWFKKQIHPKYLYQCYRQEIPYLLAHLPQVPRQLVDALNYLNKISREEIHPKNLLKKDEHKVKTKKGLTLVLLGFSVSLTVISLFLDLQRDILLLSEKTLFSLVKGGEITGMVLLVLLAFRTKE